MLLGRRKDWAHQLGNPADCVCQPAIFGAFYMHVVYTNARFADVIRASATDEGNPRGRVHADSFLSR